MADSWFFMALVMIALAVAPVLLSYLVEAVRNAPDPPAQLFWDPTISIQYIEIDGVTLRFIRIGEGPPLILLHTLRTQLDMFHKIIPELSKHFTVYALDYPGHGFSDIPKAHYTPALFVQYVRGFIEKLDVKAATVAGESIGGVISLLLAAEHNPRVKRIIAINPYDYDRGRGVLRSSWLAMLLFSLNDVPILGATFWRLRSKLAFQLIMQGGVHNSAAISRDLINELYVTGNRPYHYKAFMSLVHHFYAWENARTEYAKIKVPVLLIYGEQDWSRLDERNTTGKSIPTVESVTVKNGGHFLSVDTPDEVIEQILRVGDG